MMSEEGLFIKLRLYPKRAKEIPCTILLVCLTNGNCSSLVQISNYYKLGTSLYSQCKCQRKVHGRSNLAHRYTFFLTSSIVKKQNMKLFKRILCALVSQWPWLPILHSSQVSSVLLGIHMALRNV